MPFRLNPRIFPAAVSATVAASEAKTALRPQPPVADPVFGDSFARFVVALLGRMTELAIPAPRVAKLPTKERLPSEKDATRLLESFCTAGFFITLSPPRLRHN